MRESISIIHHHFTQTTTLSASPSSPSNHQITMRFNVFILPALVALASVQPTTEPPGGDLFVRDEYRWGLGTRSQTPHPPSN